MRRSSVRLYKIPKNRGVAPRFDTWNEKYEPWEHLKRMGRLAGTGFYIPPEWYNHFRMFPPINHNFQQEKTLNPQNQSEPTQDDTDHLSVERMALRDELARKSRLVASEGMRYYNIFWVRKPLDRMEREYYAMKRKGVPHAVAIKKVLQTFYDDLTVKKRVAAIQAEEAKLSGKFISMREATVLMGVLTQLQKEQLTPHQVTLLAKEHRNTTQDGESFEATVERAAKTPEKMEQSASAAAGDALSANSLADLLSAESAEEGDEQPTQYQVHIHDTHHDSIKQLQEAAMDFTSSADWYTGATLVLDTEKTTGSARGGSGSKGKHRGG